MFEKFSVIDLIKTRSASVCTFAGNVVKFNVQTAQELRFPEYIQFLIEPKSKQFAIRACKEDAPNAVRFSKPEGEQKAQIKISNATVVGIPPHHLNTAFPARPQYTSEAFPSHPHFHHTTFYNAHPCADWGIPPFRKYRAV